MGPGTVANDAGTRTEAFLPLEAAQLTLTRDEFDRAIRAADLQDDIE